MSEIRKRTEVLMFWAQIFFAIIFVSSQALRMLESTQGVSLSLFIRNGIFALINLSLSIVALRETKKEEEMVIKRQSVYIYVMWSSFILVHLVIALMEMPDWWNANDTQTVKVVGAGVVATLVFAEVMGVSFPDPYVRAALAIFFKSVPQVALAFSIAMYGNDGLSGVYMLTGHITILIRIAHLWMSNSRRQSRSTKASLVNEVCNDASWIVATVAWYMY